jgi:hypothetical protein
METNNQNIATHLTGELLSALAEKISDGETPTGAELDALRDRITKIAKAAMVTENLGVAEAVKEAVASVERGATLQKAKSANAGPSPLCQDIKAILEDKAAQGNLTISISDVGDEVKALGKYNIQKNNAIGDALGQGHGNGLFLETIGIGKQKKYRIPDPKKFPEFYNHPEGIPRKDYYTSSSVFRDMWDRQANRNRGRFHARHEAQALRLRSHAQESDNN